MDDFRSIEEIPVAYRAIFADYPCFNAIQSKVLDDVLYTDKSMVVSSPTGSGKTAIFELAITRLLIQCENLDISQKFKIVYISPVKSLCQERVSDWHKKFSPFGLNCVSVTGDSDNRMDFQQLINHNCIISTPEKWDSLTRKWRENEKIVKIIKLFMIDEVHLLNEENRGSTLEVIVSRMKTVENSVSSTAEGGIYSQKIRFVALSATVPNVEDIAEWIGKPPNMTFYRFSEEMRPVKLKRIVLGYHYNPKTMSPFKFDMFLSYKLQPLMMQYSEGKPTLIFCSTRKSVEMTAKHIVQTLRIHLTEEQKQKLLDVASVISDVKPKDTIRHGIGYHHAGMISETRHAIENLFRKGDLPVLVTTSTLAMGVNLPAHLVIIKSTKCYDAGSFRDYTETAIHQMIGRAGRPQFDTSATALILTTNGDREKFEKMVGCTQPIESNLHRHLTEHLNAEVVLRTITDLDVAMQWLASTFLYIRARKNPRHYGLNMGLTKDQIDKKLLEICQIDLNKLVKVGMISIDENILITPTVTGQIMARYYVAFETMKLFTQITGTEIMIQILALISKCHEFSDIYLRVNDKKTLNLLNKNSRTNTIRFPLNGKIKSWDMKVNCIIQAVLGNMDISDHSILSESFVIMRNGARIAKCLIEYLGTRGNNNCYSALLNTIILCKCFNAKLWENSPYISKQLSGIGSVMSGQLMNAGKTTFEKILQSNPRDIEMIIKRKSPMGNVLLDEVRYIPTYRMVLEKVSGRQLRLTIALENVDDLREKSTIAVTSIMTLLVGNDLNEILLYERYQHSYMIECGEMTKLINLNGQNSEVNAHFISEDWVGLDRVSTVNLGTVRTDKKDVGDKKETTYIQMFLDMYMKTKKKPTPAAKNKKKPKTKDDSKNGKDVCKNTTDDITVTETNGCVEPEKVTRMSLDENVLDTRSNKSKSQNFISKEKYSADDDRRKQKAECDDVFAEVQSSCLSDIEIRNELADSERNAANDDINSVSIFSSEENLIIENHLDKLCEAEEIKRCEDKNEIRLVGESDDYREKPDMSSPDFDQNDRVHREKSLVNIKDAVTNAPSVFHISQKYATDEYVEEEKNANASAGMQFKFLSKRKQKGGRPALMFQKKEDSKRQKLEEFKLPGRKQFHHRPNLEDLPDSTEDNGRYAITEILQPGRGDKGNNVLARADFDPETSADNGNGDSLQKSIRWRSPLVFSPAVKFSPKVSFGSGAICQDDVDNDNQNETTNETFETSDSNNISINIQQTPLWSRNVKKPSRKSRGTMFPLCDNQYSDLRNTKERHEDKAFDICSTSFLEKLGFPESQNRTNARQTKEAEEPSVAANYYSQLLSHPVQAQNVEGASRKSPSVGKMGECNGGEGTSSGRRERDEEAHLDGGDKIGDLSQKNCHDISQRSVQENRETFRGNVQNPKRCSQPNFSQKENFPPSFTQEQHPPLEHALQPREALCNKNQYRECYPRTVILAQNRSGCCSNYSCNTQRDLNSTLDYQDAPPLSQKINASVYSDRHLTEYPRDFNENYQGYANVPDQFNVDIPRCNYNCIPQRIPNAYPVQPHVLNPGNCYSVHSNEYNFPTMNLPQRHSTQYFVPAHNFPPRRRNVDCNPRSVVRHNSSQNFTGHEENFPCSQENHPPLDITLNSEVGTIVPRQRSFEDENNDILRSSYVNTLPQLYHQRERIFLRNPVDESYSLCDSNKRVPFNRTIGERPDDSTVKLLNSSQSFDEDPQRSLIYRQCLIPNNTPAVNNANYRNDWDLYEPRSTHPDDYGRQQTFPNRRLPGENCAVYSENYRFPSASNTFQGYPPNNDKEFVMNKFLYSLNHQ